MGLSGSRAALNHRWPSELELLSWHSTDKTISMVASMTPWTLVLANQSDKMSAKYSLCLCLVHCFANVFKVKPSLVHFWCLSPRCNAYSKFPECFAAASSWTNRTIWIKLLEVFFLLNWKPRKDKDLGYLLKYYYINLLFSQLSMNCNMNMYITHVFLHIVESSRNMLNTEDCTKNVCAFMVSGFKWCYETVHASTWALGGNSSYKFLKLS